MTFELKDGMAGLPRMIYEFLAQQVIDDYRITEGRCLDIGTGVGWMGLEVAKRSALQVYLLDVNGERLPEAERNSRDYGVVSRTCVIKASVEDLPFIDSYFDLIISRGSIFFWEDMAKGLAEAYRVLKQGGVAYMGGGTSRNMPRKEAEEFARWARPRHANARPDWQERNSPEYLRNTLRTAGIASYQLSKENGTWIEIRK